VEPPCFLPIWLTRGLVADTGGHLQCMLIDDARPVLGPAAPVPDEPAVVWRAVAQDVTEGDLQPPGVADVGAIERAIAEPSIVAPATPQITRSRWT